MIWDWHRLALVFKVHFSPNHSMIISYLTKEMIALFSFLGSPVDWQTPPQTRDRRTNCWMHLKQKHLQGFPLLFPKSVLRKGSSREFHQLSAFPAGNSSFYLELLFSSPGCSGIGLRRQLLASSSEVYQVTAHASAQAHSKKSPVLQPVTANLMLPLCSLTGLLLVHPSGATRK